MRQFDVVPNPDGANAADIPYLVILQHDHIRPAPSVIVASIARAEALPKIAKLAFEVSVTGQPHLVLTYDMAANPANRLGDAADNLDEHRDQFIAGIDLLFTGF